MAAEARPAARMGARRYGASRRASSKCRLASTWAPCRYVTELLSGDYLAAFGRSSHHQVWSEAMVATPLLRG